MKTIMVTSEEATAGKAILAALKEVNRLNDDPRYFHAIEVSSTGGINIYQPGTERVMHYSKSFEDLLKALTKPEPMEWGSHIDSYGNTSYYTLTGTYSVRQQHTGDTIKWYWDLGGSRFATSTEAKAAAQAHHDKGEA